jgi:hypothetical protein
MSYNTFTPIVTDGLVLYLDAANTKSYPGTGTSWLDLSKNGNSCTITNGVYSSTNIGSIRLNGVGSYFSSNSFVISGTSRTFEVWIYINSISTGGFVPILQQNSSISNGSSVSITGLQKRFGTSTIICPVANDSTFEAYTDDWTPLTGVWYHLVGVIKGGSYSRIYVNGNLQVNSSITINPTTTSKIVMSGNFAGLDYNLAVAKIYNIELTSQQILQNYNATKFRYI